MVELVGRGGQVLVALLGAYVLAFWFVLVVWTFRDIEARSRSVVTQVFATLLAVLFFVPGVLLYLILRPKETLDEAFQRSLEEEYLLQDLEELPLCPSCHRYVEDDFVLCPHCHAQLREPCVTCSRLVDLRWALCPYCAAVQHGRGAETGERVEAPAARWISPAVRRRRLADESAPQPELDVVVADARREEATEPAAAALSLDSAPEIPAEQRPSPFTFASGMRSIVRPLDRFRPREVEAVQPDGSDGTPSVQHDLPHVAFYDHAAADGVTPIDPLRRFNPSANGASAANGNSRVAHGLGHHVDAEDGAALPEPVAVLPKTPADDSAAPPPSLAAAHPDRE